MEMSVIEGGKQGTRAKPITVERDAALRRLAIQLAAQLPDDCDEAERTLHHARSLLRTFLSDKSVF